MLQPFNNCYFNYSNTHNITVRLFTVQPRRLIAWLVKWPVRIGTRSGWNQYTCDLNSTPVEILQSNDFVIPLPQPPGCDVVAHVLDAGELIEIYCGLEQKECVKYLLLIGWRSTEHTHTPRGIQWKDEKRLTKQKRKKKNRNRNSGSIASTTMKYCINTATGWGEPGANNLPLQWRRMVCKFRNCYLLDYLNLTDYFSINY